MNLLEIKALKFAHSNQTNFEFNFELPAGKILALGGSSGSGKSTLLDLIAGFLQAQSGQIVLDGKDITNAHPSKRQISILFQSGNIFEHLSVFENICLGLNPNTRATSDQQKQAERMLEEIDLAGLGPRPTHTLSGGQKQRVALAREIMRPSKLVLLDEPFTGLDVENQQAMLPLLKRVVENNERSIILVTHDVESLEGIVDCHGQIDNAKFNWL